MAQTDHADRIEHFLKTYLIQLQQEFDQCTTHLTGQAFSCPTSLQLSLVESQLKEFVRLHHLDATRKINFQLNNFKDHIREQELLQQLSTYPLTHEQVIISILSLLSKPSSTDLFDVLIKNLSLATNNCAFMSTSSRAIGKI